MSFETYVEQCKQFIDSEFKSKNRKLLIRYSRDRLGRRVGVTVAYKTDDGKVMSGWSRCNMKMDRWNKHVGVVKALQNACDISIIPESLPHSMISDFRETRERANRYFRANRPFTL